MRATSSLATYIRPLSRWEKHNLDINKRPHPQKHQTTLLYSVFNEMMFKISHLLFWSCLVAQSFAAGCGVDPVAVYDGDGAAKDAPIILKIGNGGAGQSGLVGGMQAQSLLPTC